MKYYTEILSKEQKELLPKLALLKDENFYLAGGTGLALHIGHRTSMDFDFYSASSFENDKIYSLLRQKMSSIQPIQKQRDTLILKCESLNVSLFTYPYKLLQPLEHPDELLLASLEDIAAMKLIAIIQRGSKRDFIDFYYLIKQFELKKIFKFTEKKYEDFNLYLALQALVYFDDAENVEALLDKRSDVREGALKALNKIGWKPVTNEDKLKKCIAREDFTGCTAFGKSAVSPLMKIMGDKSENIRKEIVMVFGKIGNQEAAETLSTVFGKEDSLAEKTAGEALIKIGEPSIKPLISMLENSNAKVRSNAVLILGQIKDTIAVDPLVELLSDSVSEVRTNSAVALGNIGDTRAVNPLINAMLNENFGVRREVILALGKIGDPRAIDVLNDALNDTVLSSYAKIALQQTDTTYDSK